MNRILCISLLLTFAAYGQQERIAIMHTVDNLDSIGVTDLGYLTNKLRDIASKVLPKSRYGIMTQQSIVDRLGSQERAEKECREATCLADLGRKISADYISQGRIGRFSGKLTIEVELYSVRNGNLLGAFTGDAKNLEGLLAILEAKAPKLFEDISLPPEPVSKAKKKCANKFNINELVFNIENNFSGQLKDCSATLAKNTALAASPFGKKAEQKEPKAFMTECVVDGIKQKLPVGSEEYVKPVEGFMQNLLNAASVAGGGLDLKKLSGAIGGMNVNGLIDELKDKAANDPCVVDKPYEPYVASESEEDSEDGEGKKVFSLGFRGGFNFSHMYATYDNGYYKGSGSYKPTPGFQLGLVFDWALSDWFHIQPGIMYIIKGTDSEIFNSVNAKDFDQFGYIEVPLLLSLKFSALRINAGPYFGSNFIGGGSMREEYESFFDFGLSGGLGFDIGRFYIGVFYDYGLIESYRRIEVNSHLNAYNRTLGFNFGVNL